MITDQRKKEIIIKHFKAKLFEFNSPDKTLAEFFTFLKNINWVKIRTFLGNKVEGEATEKSTHSSNVQVDSDDLTDLTAEIRSQ